MDRLLLLVHDAADPRLGGADSVSERLSCFYTVSLLGVFALLVTTRQFVGEPISCWCPIHFSNTNVDYANKDTTDPRLGGADSFCEQLSCFYTVFILGLFALLLTTRQYVGEPISCWCPVYFSSSNVDYTNKVCWTTSTYFLPFDVETIPGEDDPRRKVSYYQWVSILLVIQAVLFYAPRALWRACNRKSGIAVHTITDAAVERQRKNDPESADRIMRYMIKHMGSFLVESHRGATHAPSWKRFWLAICGNYLVSMYLFVKLVYMANIAGQIFLINAFLGTDYHMYGFDVMRRMARGENWTTSDRFPRVTLCDFKLRVLGNINRHTVQCTLPMNLINEIFFIFLWFWFMFVGLVTAASFCIWLVTSLSYERQIRFIRHRLIAMDKFKEGGFRGSEIGIEEELRGETTDEEIIVDENAGGKKKRKKNKRSEATIDLFVRKYLRRDGCFIIRLVAKNASDRIAAELIAGLWDHYKSNKRRIASGGGESS